MESLGKLWIYDDLRGFTMFMYQFHVLRCLTSIMGVPINVTSSKTQQAQLFQPESSHENRKGRATDGNRIQRNSTTSAPGHAWISGVIVPKGVVVAAEHHLGSGRHKT
jgi:hypothetical protein